MNVESEDTSQRALCIVTASDPRRDARSIRAAQSMKEKGFRILVVGLQVLEGDSLAPPIVDKLPWATDDEFLVQPNSSQTKDRILKLLLGTIGRLFPLSPLCAWLARFLPNVSEFEHQLADALQTKGVSAADTKLLVQHWPCFRAAVKGKGVGCEVFYDQRELSVSQFNYKPAWRFLMPNLVRAAEQHILSVADRVSSVLPNSEVYFKKAHGSDIKTTFIPSLPVRGGNDQNVNQTELTRRSKNLLYLGFIRPERGIEPILKTLPLLPDEVGLTCQGYGSPNYIQTLKQMAHSHGVGNRFEIRLPVEQSKIVASARGYLAGLCLFDPTFDQLRYAQPNKLYQYLSAGIPPIAAIGSSVGQQLSELNIGIAVRYQVSDANPDLVNAVQTLLETHETTAKPPTELLNSYLSLSNATDFSVFLGD